MNERTLDLAPEGMPAFLGIDREQINHSANNSYSGNDINSETHVDTANVDTTDPELLLNWRLPQSQMLFNNLSQNHMRAQLQQLEIFH